MHPAAQISEATSANDRRSKPPETDVGILGGGCAGLAVALSLASSEPETRITVVDGRREGRDPRTWCFWEEGTNPVPEAVAASWTSWQIRTVNGTATATDPNHPYRMVKAADYRRAMIDRLAEYPLVTVLQHVHVRDVDSQLEGDVALTSVGSLEAHRFLDARGTARAISIPMGRMRLHQRFLGQWIRTEKPTFETGAVTLMDFTVPQTGSDVRFVYVLPISSTEALIESTVFISDPDQPISFRDDIGRYIGRRWGLIPSEWTVTAEEAGSIPMTDARPPRTQIPAFGAQAGLARPSTGYAYSRIHRQASVVSRSIATDAPIPEYRDIWRTRTLDAVFLRFLRDQPQRAAPVFRIMFSRLPGPLTVRFLTERSSVLDELRLIAVLPKLWFLRAARTTIIERLGRPRR